MENYLKKITSILAVFLLLGLHQAAVAQQSVVASGEDAQTSAGSLSCTVGQVFCQTASSEKGKVSEGVQQPKEVFITGLSENLINDLKVGVFPNPVQHKLCVRIEQNAENVDYSLISSKGKLIKTGKLNPGFDKLDLTDLAAGIYQLQLTSSTQFKNVTLIKN